MPAATSRAELIAVTQKEWGKLDALLDGLDRAFAHEKREGDTSIKDLVAHRAHWIDLFLGWYADGRAGHEVAFPAPGYKWNELKRYNADLRARQAGLGWDAARAALRAAHARLMAFYEARSDAELYGGPMQGANNAWTAGRWSEASGASHYRSAAKWVRKRLRDAAR